MIGLKRRTFITVKIAHRHSEKQKLFIGDIAANIHFAKSEFIIKKRASNTQRELFFSIIFIMYCRRKGEEEFCMG